MSGVATSDKLSADIHMTPGTAREAAAFSGQHLTLVADIAVTSEPEAEKVLAELRADIRHVYRLVLTPAGRLDAAVQFELWTDFSDTPLRVYAPLTRVGLGAHQVALRYNRTTLDLYVDGVLMDEEFPIGRVIAPEGAAWSADAAVSSLREFHRALEVAEIVALAGGDVEARQERYIGTWKQPAWGLQYWRPSGHNEYVADTQPLFADGRFHVYFQHGRRSHGNKWGLGAHDKGHVSSTDLKHWEVHPISLGITEEWEGSLATGCAYYEDGTYYMFYTTRRPDRTQVVDLATSKDGITYVKRGSSPMLEPRPPYKVGPFRDPHVFKGPDGRYHMLVTAALEDYPIDNHGGTLAHAISDNLTDWTLVEPFLTPGYRDHEPECPDIFEWNGRHYLIFSHHGVAHYRVGQSALGPWRTPLVDTLDGPFVRVMQTAAFTGNRRLGTAFLTPPGVFGGAVIFREMGQRADGSLTMSFPRELTPRGEPFSPVVEPLGDGASAAGGIIELAADQTIAACALRGAGGNVRLTATFEASAGARAFGLVLGARDDMIDGHELRFDLPRGTVAWRNPNPSPDAGPRPPLRGAAPKLRSWDTPDAGAIHLVKGLEGPVTIEVVRLGDVLDVCINGEYTLAVLQPPHDGTDAFFYVQDGTARVRDITVERLPGDSGV